MASETQIMAAETKNLASETQILACFPLNLNKELLTSNGGCRCEGKSHKHWSLFFYLRSLQIFLFIRSNQEQLYMLIALKIRVK